MSVQQSTIEDEFLAALLEAQANAVIYLKNGIKLTGKLIGINKNVIFLDAPIPQMVYKSCISTIMSG